MRIFTKTGHVTVSPNDWRYDARM